MQQNNFNKDLKIDPLPRERPLQKSMLLPDNLTHSASPNSRANNLQFSIYTPMKKSLITPQQSASNLSANINFNQNNFTFNQGPLNFQQNNPIGSIYQSRISSQTEPAHQSYTLKSLLSPYKNDPKSQQSPQDYPRIYTKNDKTTFTTNEVKTSLTATSSNELLLQEIITQLKDKHLPNILSKLKKQIYDDIHNVRLEFQSLREEMRSTVKKQENIFNQIKFSQTNMAINANINSMMPQSKQKHDKDDQIAELQTHYFLLQGKLTQIEAKISENSKNAFQELEKLNYRLESEHKHHQIRSGPIRSILSPILLEYRESFAIKRPQNIVSRNKDEQQIIFNHCVYFIDKFGYLMDNENRYLIDHNGTQIKLDEKHLKILESHRILER